MFKKLSSFTLRTSDDPIQSLAILVLRTGVSLSMLWLHGWPKLVELMGGTPDFPDPLGIGVAPSLALATFAEVICSGLLILGALSRIAVIPLIVTMLVVIFLVNSGQPLIYREKAFIFLVSYIFILLAGSGKYSADKQFTGYFLSENH